VEERTVDLYEAIKGRRSVRKFKSTPVPKDLIEKIFEVSLWAPSGMNRQNWKFFVLAGERKEELVSISSTSFQYLEPQLQQLYAEKPKIIESLF
jgi:nitroreductase